MHLQLTSRNTTIRLKKKAQMTIYIGIVDSSSISRTNFPVTALAAKSSRIGRCTQGMYPHRERNFPDLLLRQKDRNNRLQDFTEHNTSYPFLIF